jgi:hypothetical protein
MSTRWKRCFTGTDHAADAAVCGASDRSGPHPHHGDDLLLSNISTFGSQISVMDDASLAWPDSPGPQP